MKALQDLDNSASCDAAVRERIAAFPPEVSDVSLLEKIKGTLLCTLRRKIDRLFLYLLEFSMFLF